MFSHYGKTIRKINEMCTQLVNISNRILYSPIIYRKAMLLIEMN